jgi:hypothetical protein
MEKENFIKLQKLISNSYDLKELAGHKMNSLLVNMVDSIRSAIELFVLCMLFGDAEDKELYKKIMLVCFNKHTQFDAAHDIAFFEKELAYIHKRLQAC